MVENKQLTVAEILAKAQQDNPEAGKRRRRRRSLEEGGVSVAELTGSLKKVDARPVEAKHSSVPIDGPEPAAPVKPAAPEAAKLEAAKPASTRITPPKPAAAKPEAAKPAEAKTTATKPAAPKAAETQPAVVKVEVEKPTVEKQPAPKPFPKPEAKKPAAPKAEAEDKTVVMKAVKDRPADAEKPADTAKLAAPTPAASKPTETKPAPAKQEESFDPFAEDFVEVKPEGTFERDFERDPKDEPAAADPVVVREREKLDTVPADEIEIEEDSINPIVLVLLVFLGVVVGILGFLLFQWVWANTSAIVAAIIAAVVVAGVVFGVRAMRTGRDGLTMTLAGLAAAVAAFGPALL